MSEIQETTNAIQATLPSGMGIFVQFKKLSDRYLHQIGLVQQQQKIIVLESVESGSNEIWPASPAIQQIYQQQIDQHPAVLGVGMAGSSHFSISVLLKRIDDSVEMTVEWACSLKKNTNQTPRLQSNYRIAPGWSHKENPKSLTNSNLPHQLLLNPVTSKLILDEQAVFEPKYVCEEKANQWGYNIRVV